MGQFTKYLWLLVKRAAENSVFLTDKLTILIVPFSTLALWLLGAKMSESVQETLAIGVAISVVSVVVLRLVAASYLVWKDDQKEKSALQSVIDAPSWAVGNELKTFTTEARKKLSDRLARLSAIANLKPAHLERTGITIKEINILSLEIDALINQLSYNVPVRICSIHLKDYCMELISGSQSDRKRLWHQRKITFRILHKDDEIGDILSLIELEILIEKHTGKENPFGTNSSPLLELKESARQINKSDEREYIINSLKKMDINFNWEN